MDRLAGSGLLGFARASLALAQRLWAATSRRGHANIVQAWHRLDQDDQL